MGFWLFVLLIFMGIIFYVGWRGHRAFDILIPEGYGKAYWLLFLLFAFSFMLERFGVGSGWGINKALTWIGSYSVAFIFYAFLFLLVLDMVRFLDRRLGFFPSPLKQPSVQSGFAVILLLIALLAYGTWNAEHPVFHSYTINMPKTANHNQQVHAIMLSDLHLGVIVDNDRLEELIKQINKRNPDIVFLVGDVIDDDIQAFLEQDMLTTLRQLNPRMGTFMVLGNHDGHDKKAVPYLQQAGITVLIDQYQLVDNSFYLVGRDDRGYGRGGESRLELSDIITGINPELPIILMDHNPADLEEAVINGIDLQLSGHTHQGQLFPNNLITARMYEIDWGYLHKENLQVVVSTGFGTWGPPIRIGNTPEVVDLTLCFQ